MRFLNKLIWVIYRLRVLYKDLMPRNILQNKETVHVVMVDFGWANVVKPRSVLGAILVNRKRKRAFAVLILYKVIIYLTL